MPVLARFSLGGGNPEVPDAAPTGKPDPEKLKAYVQTHPDAMALIQLSSHHSPTANYYQTTYFSIHAFKFIDAKSMQSRS